MERSKSWCYILILVVVLSGMSLFGIGCSSDGSGETDTETKGSSESEITPADSDNLEGGYSLSVTVNPAGGGTVDPSKGSFIEGATVSLTAIPSTGYSFSRWGGDVIGSSRSISFTMDSDKNVVAYFSAMGERTIQRIEVIPPSSTMSVNGRQQFTVTARYSDGTSTTVTSAAIWRTSNPTVATVSSSGMAVALKPGAVIITAILDAVQGRAVLVVQP